jgi:hypothetical protein
VAALGAGAGGSTPTPWRARARRLPRVARGPQADARIQLRRARRVAGGAPVGGTLRLIRGRTGATARAGDVVWSSIPPSSMRPRQARSERSRPKRSPCAPTSTVAHHGPARSRASTRRELDTPSGGRPWRRRSQRALAREAKRGSQLRRRAIASGDEPGGARVVEEKRNKTAGRARAADHRQPDGAFAARRAGVPRRTRRERRFFRHVAARIPRVRQRVSGPSRARRVRLRRDGGQGEGQRAERANAGVAAAVHADALPGRPSALASPGSPAPPRGPRSSSWAVRSGSST